MQHIHCMQQQLEIYHLLLHAFLLLLHAFRLLLQLAAVVRAPAAKPVVSFCVSSSERISSACMHACRVACMHAPTTNACMYVLVDGLGVGSCCMHACMHGGAYTACSCMHGVYTFKIMLSLWGVCVGFRVGCSSSLGALLHTLNNQISSLSPQQLLAVARGLAKTPHRPEGQNNAFRLVWR